MQCDKCSNDANIEIYVSDGHGGEKISLCFSCYQDIINSGMENLMGMHTEEIFKKFMEEFDSYKFSIEEEDLDVVCPKCGKSMRQIGKDKKFGCDYCYSEFEPKVADLIQSTQSSSSHIGKYPEKYEEINKIKYEIQSRKLELEDSVVKEDYENAALIKSKIDELTKELQTLSGEING